MLFSSGPGFFPPFSLPEPNPFLLRHPFHFPQPKLSPGGSEGSTSSRAQKSPEASSNSSASPKFFRPWLKDEEPRSPPPPSPEKRRGRVSGSRNERVVPVEPTPLIKQQSALEAIATNLGKSGVGHRCIYCGKIYSRKYGLKIHLRTHTGFKPLKCRICDRAFGDPSNLNKHTRLHAENGMGYRCGPCDKVLLRRRDLDRHLVSRHALHPSSPLPPFVQHHPLPPL